MNQSRFLALSGTFALAPLALAQPHSGDVILTVNEGQIRTNGASNPVRVFAATLGASFPDFTDSPGFDCLPGTFTTGTRNGFRILAPLLKWNGASFPSTPDQYPQEQLEIAFASLVRTTPVDASIVQGFTLAVGSNGQWHRHLEYTLLPPATDGVYLLQLELFSTNLSLSTSPPFYIIFNQNSDGDTALSAATWVESNLIFPRCPADWDSDDDVDSDDIVAFFAAWEGGEGDIDSDSDSDSDDIVFFFSAWDAGC